MPETDTVDEVVSTRGGNARGGGLSSRPVESDSVAASTGVSTVDRSGIENETHSEGGRRARTFKGTTAKLLEKFEEEAKSRPAAAPHEEGDGDDAEDDAGGSDEAGADAGESGDDTGGDEGESDDAGAAEGHAEGDGEEAGEEVDPTAVWEAEKERLATRNRELISELDSARKTPKAQRTERETALVAAESSYFDEGSVAALRKFLSVVTGAAPDSKEVDAELAGIYTDLTAKELGVALDGNQQALRDNARTRLLLARDKREKAEAEKKPAPDDSAEAVQYENAAKHVDNLLGTKEQGGASLADEYPLLMNLAQDFDNFPPGEVLARAIRQEIMTGTLDIKTSDIDMIRIVAPKIEKHYDAVAKRIEAARAKKTKKPDTTTPSGTKPKAAVDTSQEQRQSTGARTLTNAAASRAPATLPKTTTKPKAKQSTEKSRKDFKSEKEWKDHLFSKHFPA